MNNYRATAIQFLYPLARTLLTGTFVISAVRHLMNWDAALNEMANDGMPRSDFLLLGSIALRLIGGLMVIAGFHARLGAVLLVAFVIPAAFVGHDFWAMPAARRTHETIEFLNNMAIAAGALLIVLSGPGPVSFDVPYRRQAPLDRRNAGTITHLETP
jgi:putative oxidoreductase